MSFNAGNSLKGYQWLNDKDEVIMYYTFKEQKIELASDVTKEDHLAFVTWLNQKGWPTSVTDCHWYKIIFDEDIQGDK